jgi:uncharacterized protein (DUF427 family)
VHVVIVAGRFAFRQRNPNGARDVLLPEGANVTTARESTSETREGTRVEHGAKRIRAYLGGQVVVDTTRPLLVWEHPRYPTYFFPAADVRLDLLQPQHYKTASIETPGDTVRLEWDAMDAWFEEDEEVFVHARDPYTRVDILASSRHVRVEVDGTTVAETVKPTLLFETGHPVRYYLPKTDVRMDLLTPSDRVTRCPYKGQAEYWSLPNAGRADVAWSYRTPLPESQKIAGLICFYPEKVDVFVDAEPVRR